MNYQINCCCPIYLLGFNAVLFFRVSSVLNKNSKEYGKQYMVDNCDDTCWNSAQVCDLMIFLHRFRLLKYLNIIAIYKFLLGGLVFYFS